MTKQRGKEMFVWGFFLWTVGYILGIVLFTLIPHTLIGWVILPIGTVLTLWVLVKKVKANTLPHFVLLGSVWTLIAIVCDYLLIVKAFKPADGYYKLDVFIYYGLTFLLPVVVGWYTQMKQRGRSTK